MTAELKSELYLIKLILLLFRPKIFPNKVDLSFKRCNFVR